MKLHDRLCTAVETDVDVRYPACPDHLASTGASALSPPSNMVCGWLQAIEYQGAYVQVTIRRPGQEDVVAHVAERELFAKPTDIGDQVAVRWAIEDAHLLQAEEG